MIKTMLSPSVSLIGRFNNVLTYEHMCLVYNFSTRVQVCDAVSSAICCRFRKATSSFQPLKIFYKRI